MRPWVGICLSLAGTLTAIACGRGPLDDPGGTRSAGSSGSAGAAGDASGAAGVTASGGAGGTNSSTGTAGAAGIGGTGSGGGGAPGAAGVTGRMPTMHRPTATACPIMMLPPNTPTMCSDANDPLGATTPGWCKNDSDCTNGEDGRCVAIPPGPAPNCGCTYDACFSDGDCSANGVCACSGAYSGNACIPGNCHVDADCGVGGYCSPSFHDCGFLVAYQCHTSKDQCVNDADCGPYGCAYDPTMAVWACRIPAFCPS